MKKGRIKGKKGIGDKSKRKGLRKDREENDLRGKRKKKRGLGLKKKEKNCEEQNDTKQQQYIKSKEIITIIKIVYLWMSDSLHTV